jgi:hypothetical protein
MKSLENIDTLGVFGPKVWYFVINKTHLDYDYKDNARMFDEFDSLLSIPHIHNNIDSVYIVAAASPIGNADYNQFLSEGRARSLQEYLMLKYPFINGERIVTRAIGIDEDGYRSICEKEEKRIKEMSPVQHREWLLQEVSPQLQYVSINITLNDGTRIPSSRGSPIRALIQQSNTTEIVTRDTIRITTYDTIRVTLYDTVRHSRQKEAESFYVIKERLRKTPSSTLFTLKTNLVYDLALLPNLALEYSITPRYSVAIEGYWAWWDTHAPNYWSYRIQAVGVEGKYWLGNRGQRARLAGHYAGVHLMMGNYDIRLFPRQLSDKGYLSTFSYSAGLTYGYVLPIGRRWDMEFSIGLGYWGGQYYVYDRSACTDCYPMRADKQQHYFGPTRTAVNLIYRIGQPHENK